MSSPVFIDAKEAAKLLSLTLSEVLRLARSGKIPCVEIKANRFMFSPEVLRAWAIDTACSSGHEPLALKVRGEFTPQHLSTIAELLVELSESRQDEADEWVKKAYSDGGIMTFVKSSLSVRAINALKKAGVHDRRSFEECRCWKTMRGVGQKTLGEIERWAKSIGWTLTHYTPDQ